MKKVFTFILLLLPWFVSSLFMVNNNYYNTIKLPKFAPSSIVFGIVWPILFLLITISVFMIYNKYKFSNKSYNISLLINYLFNQSFTIFFFALKSPFLGLLTTLGTFISSLFLFNETYPLDKKASYFLIPYILWNAFASVLAFAIYLLNL